MFAAFLAAFFFALNATCATHSVRASGALRANLGRLVVAAVVLGLFAHTLGRGFASASVPWFFLSGVIGMGLGDLGVYGALPLLGSRLTVLMTQCLAAPIAALGEWWWLGTRLTVTQMFWGLLILASVAIALTPSKRHPPRVKIRPLGFLFGLLAAAGQGLGALVSRKGVTVADAAGEAAHAASFGLTAAYYRILAGLAFVALWFVVLRLLHRLPAAPAPQARSNLLGYTFPAARLWILINGFVGPVLGVGCYQWALATAPSGLVLPIAATAPLLAIPIAYFFEGDRPPRRAIFGGVLAVAGCIALTAAR
ncbi:DMT family transporter [Horticoccus luteus]|uniref:DMT family transporter n=1 Tax=Horticoccus luteus TaxID=2862869 RepID=A0A8F9TSF7_9BACT|nr:DMT family transporter [Horticoccus luteus]QYM78196.1 DMT family transporter [Horticoccus luteus]